jgi:hypothetical protein
MRCDFTGFFFCLIRSECWYFHAAKYHSIGVPAAVP